MIANTPIFQCIVFSKSNDHITTSFFIKDKEIESKSSVELLGVYLHNIIDIIDMLKFSTHISNICKKAGGQTKRAVASKNVFI